MPINNCSQREYTRHSCNPNTPREHGNCSCNPGYEPDSLPLAMAYVPRQHFHTTYEVDKALSCGTIFPELYKPFSGKRGVHR